MKTKRAYWRCFLLPSPCNLITTLIIFQIRFFCNNFIHIQIALHYLILFIYTVNSYRIFRWTVSSIVEDAVYNCMRNTMQYNIHLNAIWNIIYMYGLYVWVWLWITLKFSVLARENDSTYVFGCLHTLCLLYTSRCV